jgi:hypothetical protein
MVVVSTEIDCYSSSIGYKLLVFQKKISAGGGRIRKKRSPEQKYRRHRKQELLRRLPGYSLIRS